MSRMSRDAMLMHIAAIVSQRGTCSRKQVGCVISREGRIISTGYAGAPSGQPHCSDVGCDIGPDGGCERTVHAEANAIVFAARAGIKTDGAELISTCGPCYDCAKLIINAGITEVTFLEGYRDSRGEDLIREVGGVCVLYNSTADDVK